MKFLGYILFFLFFNINKACVGVDPSNVKQFDDEIMIDGQPTKIDGLNQQNNKEEM